MKDENYLSISKILKKILLINKGNLLWYLGLCLSTLLIPVYSIVWSESFRQMVNGATYSDYYELKNGLYLAGLVLIIDSLTQFISTYYSSKLDIYSTLRVQSRIIKKILSISMKDFRKYNSSNYITTINEFVPNVQYDANKRIRDIIGVIVTIFITLTYLGFINIWLTLGTLLLSIIFPFLMNFLSKTLRSIGKEIQKLHLERQSFMQDALQGATEVRMLSLTQRFTKILNEKSETILTNRKKMIIVNQLIGQVNSISTQLCIFFILSYGGILALRGDIGIGEIVAFFYSSMRIFNPIPSLVSMWSQLQDTIVKADKIFEILDLPDEVNKDVAGVYQSIGKMDFEESKDERGIRFENVTFQYYEHQPVLNQISFNIERNKITALVGPSGSGKSTIFRLLLRFYEPDSGKILSDGIPIASTPIQNWRNKLAYVPQDNYLFSGTVYENIKLGNLSASTDRLVSATKAASAHEFLSNAIEGYNMEIVENGTNISGGEKQRISIARAFVRDPDLLLLDEPTSSLDSRNAENIMSEICELMQGRTILIIAHRKSTMMMADKIIYIENGSVQEVGTYTDLCHRKGKFYERICKT